MKFRALAVLNAYEVLRNALQGTRRPGTNPPNTSDVENIVQAFKSVIRAEIELAKAECEQERSLKMNADTLT